LLEAKCFTNRASVLLDRRIELLRIEGLEPGAQPSKLAGRKPLDCLFDVFCGGHARDIAPVSAWKR
jgi:hypothetical protein